MAETRQRPASGSGDAHRELPEHVTAPLLTLITARSMDEDYAHVAQKRAAAGEQRPQAARPHWASIVAVGVLGLLAAVVAVQTHREADVNELSRAALVEKSHGSPSRGSSASRASQVCQTWRSTKGQ